MDEPDVSILSMGGNSWSSSTGSILDFILLLETLHKSFHLVAMAVEMLCNLCMRSSGSYHANGDKALISCQSWHAGVASFFRQHKL